MQVGERQEERERLDDVLKSRCLNHKKMRNEEGWGLKGCEWR